MGVRKKQKISSYPPCDDDAYAVDRAKRESKASTLGYVTERFQAMVGDAAKAAYSRTYVNEYRRAWHKDWPYLYEMLQIIETEHTYDKPWLKDGVPQPTYPTFQAYCEAEVEPFVGPIASLRERYLELKNGKIDVNGGAQQQKAALTLSLCRKAYQEIRAEGRVPGWGIKAEVAARTGVTPQRVGQMWAEIENDLPTVGKSFSKITQAQRAATLGVSDEQLRRMDIVAKHVDLHQRTVLPKSDPQHISTRAAYLEVRRREGRGTDLDVVEPIRKTLMKLDEPSQRIVIEWVLEWAKDRGYIP